MATFFAECVRLLVELWNVSNWYVRAAIRVMVAWPLILFGVEVAGWGSIVVTPLLTLIPLIALLMFLWNWQDPLVLAIVASFEGGRKAIRWFATLMGVELALGIVFSIFPVEKDPELIPLFFISIAALSFLTIGGHGGLAAFLRGGASIVLLGIIAIWLLGGKTEAAKTVEEAKGWFEISSSTSPKGMPAQDVKSYALPAGEWTPTIETGGRRYQVDWETPDKKLWIRFEFWHGNHVVREFEYGKPTQDVGPEPCNLRFFHPNGGTIKVTLF